MASLSSSCCMLLLLLVVGQASALQCVIMSLYKSSLCNDVYPLSSRVFWPSFPSVQGQTCQYANAPEFTVYAQGSCTGSSNMLVWDTCPNPDCTTPIPSPCTPFAPVASSPTANCCPTSGIPVNSSCSVYSTASGITIYYQMSCQICQASYTNTKILKSYYSSADCSGSPSLQFTIPDTCSSLAVLSGGLISNGTFAMATCSTNYDMQLLYGCTTSMCDDEVFPCSSLGDPLGTVPYNPNIGYQCIPADNGPTGSMLYSCVAPSAASWTAPLSLLLTLTVAAVTALFVSS